MRTCQRSRICDATHGMQKGWQERAKVKLFRESERWTEVDFEYSALVILRDRSPVEEDRDGQGNRSDCG